MNSIPMKKNVHSSNHSHRSLRLLILLAVARTASASFAISFHALSSCHNNYNYNIGIGDGCNLLGSVLNLCSMNGSSMRMMRLFSSEHDDNNDNMDAVNDSMEDEDDSGPRSRSRSRSRSRRRNDDRGQVTRSATSRRNRPSSAPVRRRRAPHQFDHTKEEARPFLEDPKAVIRDYNEQEVDEESVELLDLSRCSELNCLTPGSHFDGDSLSLDDTRFQHVQFKSLSEIFPDCENDFSLEFDRNTAFRNELRAALREDVFDSTPMYMNMPDKARQVLLLPDSSLQGSWKCHVEDDNNPTRMVKLTKILREYLGEGAPTGDDFMNAIGSLCGNNPTTHWIDIVGVLDRRVPHSWHQDTGKCRTSKDSKEADRFTVMLGFPAEDHYNGVGVFSHSVKLTRERWASNGDGNDEAPHPDNEPIVYSGTVEDKYIVRPRFSKGREIMLYRDVDVIHSAPDVAYRSSVMRFM